VETEYLNGEIVRLAAKLGLEAPLNARLVKTMKEITARHAGPGSYQPAQLMTMLGLNMPAGI
jgi:2-dehydropantoate 2-reductase